MREFICEQMKGEGGQLSVTNELRAANKTDTDIAVVDLNGHPTEVRIVEFAEAREMCR